MSVDATVIVAADVVLMFVWVGQGALEPFLLRLWSRFIPYEIETYISILNKKESFR